MPVDRADLLETVGHAQHGGFALAKADDRSWQPAVDSEYMGHATVDRHVERVNDQIDRVLATSSALNRRESLCGAARVRPRVRRGALNQRAPRCHRRCALQPFTPRQ